MKVSSVMTRDVRSILPRRSVRDAARLMDELNVGVVPVCEEERLLGILTDRDIAIRAVAGGLNPESTRVEEVMSTAVRACHPADDTAEVSSLMSGMQVRRIPVVDDEGRLVGIVALGDLATDDTEEAAGALKHISEPSEPHRTGSLSHGRADQTRQHREP